MFSRFLNVRNSNDLEMEVEGFFSIFDEFLLRSARKRPAFLEFVRGEIYVALLISTTKRKI